jgi:hypothetical protein
VSFRLDAASRFQAELLQESIVLVRPVAFRSWSKLCRDGTNCGKWAPIDDMGTAAPNSNRRAARVLKARGTQRRR